MWVYSKAFIDEHLAGNYNSALGSIERASKNAPIQGSCADMVKLAMVYVYKWIRENNYVDRINLVLNIHDELQTVCEDSLASMWVEKLDELMVAAGKVILPSGILKADSQISPYWTK